jgi:hypothetical protein
MLHKYQLFKCHQISFIIYKLYLLLINQLFPIFKKSFYIQLFVGLKEGGDLRHQIIECLFIPYFYSFLLLTIIIPTNIKEKNPL